MSAVAARLASGLDAGRHRAFCRLPTQPRAELPLGRLLRLSLFQVSVGVAMVLLIGTLNRVMIVELGVPAWLVAVMVGLPLVFAPFRAFDRLSLRQPPLGAGLAARSVHLDGHVAAVRRPGHHAVCADRSCRATRTARSLSARSARHSRSCWSAPGCRRPDRRARPCHRSRARARCARGSSRCCT